MLFNEATHRHHQHHQELLRNAQLPAPALPNQMGVLTGSQVLQKSASEVPSTLTPFMEQMVRPRSRDGEELSRVPQHDSGESGQGLGQSPLTRTEVRVLPGHLREGPISSSDQGGNNSTASVGLSMQGKHSGTPITEQLSLQLPDSQSCAPSPTQPKARAFTLAWGRQVRTPALRACSGAKMGW